jgi:hypothetical protein
VAAVKTPTLQFKYQKKLPFPLCSLSPVLDIAKTFSTENFYTTYRQVSLGGPETSWHITKRFSFLRFVWKKSFSTQLDHRNRLLQVHLSWLEAVRQGGATLCP